MTASSWQPTTFAKLIDEGSLHLSDGYRAKNDELGGNGPIFLRAGHVSDSHIDFGGVERFHESLYDRLVPKMSQPGDVVITTKGNSTGRVTYVTPAMPRFVYSPHLSFWRSLNRDIVEPGFLRYWSRGAEFRRQLDGYKVSTDMAPYISLIDQKRLCITLPSILEQRRIAEILGTLDEKIELNRRMNETLEGMARAIFKSWFVDFDPVRAKAAGRQPAGMDAATAANYPARFQESALGPIPFGWEVKPAEDISLVSIGKTPPRKEPEWFSRSPSDVPWISIRDLGEARVFISRSSEFLTTAAIERFRVKRIPDNTVVLSFKLTMGRVAITDGEMLSNEAIAHFNLGAGSVFNSEYLYCYLKAFNFDVLGSTSSIATAINSDMVRRIPILVPSETTAQAFNQAVHPIFTEMRNLQRQSYTLAQMRDALLPKLLSGQIRIPDAEALLESA